MEKSASKSFDIPMKVKAKSVYGRICFYPSCPLSSAIVDLIHRKSFSSRQIKEMKEKGFKINVESLDGE